MVGSTGTIRLRDRWLVVLAGLGFAVACVAVNARRPPTSVRTRQILNSPLPASSSSGPPGDGLGSAPPSRFHFDVPWWLVRGVLTLLIAGVAVLAILLIIRLVPRLQWRARRRVEEEEPVYAPAIASEEVISRVSSTLDDTLDAFRRGDRQRAIIACWIRLEQIAEAAGFARHSSETSTELAERWLAVLPVSREALLVLAELYREARYSSHPLGEPALVAARAALEQLRREIAPAAGGTVL